MKIKKIFISFVMIALLFISGCSLDDPSLNNQSGSGAIDVGGATDVGGINDVGGSGITDVVDDGMVRTVLNGGGIGAPSLPYYVSTEIVERCFISDRKVNANIYLGHNRWQDDSVYFSELDHAISKDELKNCSFTLVANYNGEKRIVIADDVDYASDLYDVTIRDMWEGDVYKGSVVNYSKFEQVNFDIASLLGVSYGFVNIELRVKLPMVLNVE